MTIESIIKKTVDKDSINDDDLVYMIKTFLSFSNKKSWFNFFMCCLNNNDIIDYQCLRNDINSFFTKRFNEDSFINIIKRRLNDFSIGINENSNLLSVLCFILLKHIYIFENELNEVYVKTFIKFLLEKLNIEDSNYIYISEYFDIKNSNKNTSFPNNIKTCNDSYEPYIKNANNFNKIKLFPRLIKDFENYEEIVINTDMYEYYTDEDNLKKMAHDFYSMCELNNNIFICNKYNFIPTNKFNSKNF